MELHFVSPELSDLDTHESEVLACTIWQDQRPCDGVASLCDWRFAGELSRLMRSGYLTGRRGEVLMIPGRPRLSFDKVLLFGAGRRADFDDRVCGEIVAVMLRTVSELKSRLAVVQLPGRNGGLILPERAADMLLEVTTREPDRFQDDVWTLVEDAGGRRRIEQHMIEERRRIRR